MTFDLDRYLAERAAAIDRALGDRLGPAPAEDPSRLHAAMRHALLAGGKRLRPILTLACAEAVGGAEAPIAAACAVELVHAYSLVHDDLPAMDDAATRRGRPSVHRAFGQAAAILAGDALLTAAFEALSDEGARRGREAAYLRAAGELAGAAGWRGMVGGQALDLEQQQAPPRDLAALERCAAAKTAAMFGAAAAIGALCGGGGEADVARLRGLGLDLGLAFQHADDLRDGDHAALAAPALARAEELCARAARVAEELGASGRVLAALAERVRRRAADAAANPRAG